MTVDDRPPLDDVLIDLIAQFPLPISIERLSDKTLIYLSPGFTELFGYTLEDTPTCDIWFQKAYPDPRERQEMGGKLRSMTEALLRGEKPAQNMVAKVTCKNGAVRQIGFVASVSCGHMIAFFKDVTERVEAEEALRESERYNRMLFESSPVGLALNRMDGAFVDVNEAFARIVGYSADEILARGYWDLTPKDYADDEQVQLADLMETARFGPYEKEYIHKDGHRVPVRLNGVLVERDGEKYIWSSVEDISDQKITENSLRDSEQRERARANELETLLDSIPIPVFIAHDADCKYVTGNRVAHDMVGLPTDINPSKTPPEGQQPGYRTMHNGVEIAPEDLPMQLAAATGKPIFEYPITVLRADGTERETLGNAAPLFDAEGKPRGSVGVFIDITEQLKVEKSLRESEQRERARAAELETVIEQVPLPVFIAYDVDCMVITGNRAAHDLVGVPEGANPSQFLKGPSLTYKTLTNGQEIPLDERPMQRVAASGVPVVGYPLTLMLEDGAERQTLCNAAPLFDAQGQSRGAVGVLVDITEQLEVEKSLRESEQRERARAVELETVIEQVPLPVFIAYSADCSVMTGNQAAYGLLGIPKGSNPSLTAPEDERPNYRTLRNGNPVELYDHPMHRAAALGVPVIGDALTIIWADGTERQSLNNAAPLFDSEGKVRGVVGVSIDITEQLAVKKALEVSLEQARAANEQLRFQFDHLPVAYIVWDPEFRVTAWNPAAERVFGWTSEEAVGRHASELMVSPAVRDHVDGVWTRIINSDGKVEHSINENITRDGREITCEWFTAPLRDSAGNIVSCLSMVNDITERINTQSQLLLAGEVFENCREAIMVSDESRKILAVNPAFTKLTGYTEQEVLGKDVVQLLSAHPDAEVHVKIMQALIDEGHWQGEVFDRRKNGEVFPSLVSASAVKDAEGNIVNRISFFIDLTERLEAETAVRYRTEQMVLVTDTLPFMVAYVDDRLHLTFMNREFEEVHGISREAALGNNIADVLPEALGSHCCPKIEAGLLGERAQYEEVVPLPRDGLRLCRSIFLPHADNGKVVGVFVIIEDITEQRKAEDDLRQAQKLQSLGTLAGGISHDLNNLLTPIIGLTELVLEDMVEEENAQSLQDVLSAAERAQRLVGQILAFSRKDAPNRQELLLAPLIDETIVLMRVAMPSSVRITRDIQPASPVQADATQIQQIIMNLCSNAAHAMGLQGGELLVSLRNISPRSSFYAKHPGLRRGQYVELVIRDTGCGMSQHTLLRIFEPFFTTKAVGEGTGMGLSVVHGIVAAHQGAIEVTSELGKGTAFKIYLPAADNPSPGARQG